MEIHYDIVYLLGIVFLLLAGLAGFYLYVYKRLKFGGSGDNWSVLGGRLGLSQHFEPYPSKWSGKFLPKIPYLQGQYKGRACLIKMMPLKAKGQLNFVLRIQFMIPNPQALSFRIRPRMFVSRLLRIGAKTLLHRYFSIKTQDPRFFDQPEVAKKLMYYKLKCAYEVRLEGHYLSVTAVLNPQRKRDLPKIYEALDLLDCLHPLVASYNQG